MTNVGVYLIFNMIQYQKSINKDVCSEIGRYNFLRQLGLITYVPASRGAKR